MATLPSNDLEQLESALHAAFPSEREGEPEADTARSWLAGIMGKGLTRVYAIHLAECFDVKHQRRLIQRVRERTGNGELAGQLEKLLQPSSPSAPREQQNLVRLLGPVAFEGIDRVMQQARTVGREQTTLHLAAARWGEELVVLADPDPQRAWLLAGTQKRLLAALAELGVFPTAAQTQDLDLTQGDTLHLLDYEFRLVGSRRAGWRIQYKHIEAATGWEDDDEAAVSNSSTSWLFAPLQFFLRRRTSTTSRRGAPRKPKKTLVQAGAGTEADDRGPSATRPGIPAAAPTAIDVPFPGFLDRVGSLRALLSYSLPLPSLSQIGFLVLAGCKRWPWLPALVAAAAVLFGIYLRGGSVGGTVQRNGRPVEQGWVVFEPTDSSEEQNTSHLTARIENGKYGLRGLEPGTYSVVVLVPDLRTRRSVEIDVGYLWTTQNFDLDAPDIQK
jgi:hypothetical protein